MVTKTNRNQKITSVGENVGKVEHSYTSGENVQWCSRFEKVAVPQNVKQSCRSTQHVHSCIKRDKNRYSHRNVCISFHGGVVHDSQKVKVTQCLSI